jgi:hypothetical protein
VRSDRKKIHLGALFVAFSVLLSGCAFQVDNAPSTTKEGQSTTPAPEESAELRVDWRTIELPSYSTKCSSQTELISRLDIEEYANQYEAVEKTELWQSAFYEVQYLDAGVSTEDSGWNKWDDQVRGIALVKTREYLSASEDKTIRELESSNRADFLSFAERVFQKILDDCDLQEDYLTRLEILNAGRLLVAEKKAAQITDEMREQFAKSLAESTAGWDGSQEAFDWRWGGECSASFGYCKEVIVKVNKTCTTLFVEANFNLSGEVVDSAIDSVRNLSAGSTARLQLRTAQSSDTVELTRLSCY